MPLTPTATRREASRLLRRTELRLGDEIRRLRHDANVSLAAVGRAARIDPAYIGRIEAGVEHPSIEVLTAIGIVLGADLSIRYFTGAGPRIHDRFQAPMLEALLRILHPRWRAELEVAVRTPAHGVIDAVLRDAGARTVVATEAQSELRRVEQQIRWSREKAHALASNDPESRASQLLLLRSTQSTREIARVYEQTLRTAFPARAIDAFSALTRDGPPWPGAAIVWVDLRGRSVTVMDRPPRGVSLGR